MYKGPLKHLFRRAFVYRELTFRVVQIPQGNIFSINLKVNAGKFF